jgi:hypothetical protein
LDVKVPKCPIKAPKLTAHPFALKKRLDVKVPKCPIKVPKCPTSLSLERVGGVLVWVALALELVDSVVLCHLVVVYHMPAIYTLFQFGNNNLKGE